MGNAARSIIVMLAVLASASSCAGQREEGSGIAEHSEVLGRNAELEAAVKITATEEAGQTCLDIRLPDQKPIHDCQSYFPTAMALVAVGEFSMQGLPYFVNVFASHHETTFSDFRPDQQAPGMIASAGEDYVLVAFPETEAFFNRFRVNARLDNGAMSFDQECVQNGSPVSCGKRT